MDNVSEIAQIAATEWHPAWFILCLLLVFAGLALWKLAKAYVGVVEKVVVLQHDDVQLKRQLIAAIRHVNDSIQQILRELDK